MLTPLLVVACTDRVHHAGNQTLVHNLTGVQPFPSTRGVRNPDHGLSHLRRISL